MKIKKITEIKNFSIFKDFNWNENLNIGNNQTYDFKDINIFYGRNGFVAQRIKSKDFSCLLKFK